MVLPSRAHYTINAMIYPSGKGNCVRRQCCTSLWGSMIHATLCTRSIMQVISRPISLPASNYSLTLDSSGRLCSILVCASWHACMCVKHLATLHAAFFEAKTIQPLTPSMRQCIRTWHSHSLTTSSTPPTTPTWRGTSWGESPLLMPTSELSCRDAAV